jgi:phosphatidylglycerophosphatase A
MRRFLLFIASGAFLGYIPVASGTFGTLAGIPLFWAFDALRDRSLTLYAAAFVILVLASCWVAGKAEAALAEHDSHKIVIDEIAGFVAATLWLDFTWANVVAAFLIFRLFDILKPFPAGYIDRKFPGGYGIVLDDVVAGLYANLATRLLFLLF